MTDPDTWTIPFTGRYDLARSAAAARQAAFLDGASSFADRPGVMHVSMVLDSVWQPVAVRLEQGPQHVSVTLLDDPGSAGPHRVTAQLRRVLSLDGDGAAFEALAHHDPVLGARQRSHPGLRPWLHASPYEALARAIIMHRLFRGQVVAVISGLSREFGLTVSVAGVPTQTFPTPAALAMVERFPGLADRKVEQLRALGAAAADGHHAAETMRSLPREEAMRHLTALGGIGPFSAELVMIRGVGDRDVFPETEKSLHRAMEVAYGLGAEPSLEALRRVAATWSPFRSWAGLLLRQGHA